MRHLHDMHDLQVKHPTAAAQCPYLDAPWVRNGEERLSDSPWELAKDEDITTSQDRDRLIIVTNRG